MNEFIDKTAANWIELIWDLSIYYPDKEDAFEWADLANKILDIKDERDLINYDDSCMGTAEQAFCERPVEYHTKRPKEFYEKFIS